MQAKFVYEAMGDILKPRSEEEIWSSIGDLSPDNLIYKSISNSFLPGIKKAIEMGADVHAYDDWALRYASLHGHYNIVKILLENGANVHVGNNYALRFASANGHYDVVKILLENGADVHVMNNDALRYASISGHRDIIELLKKYMKDEG